MPRKGYTKKLSDEDIIRLVAKGRYNIDIESGIITSGRTEKEIFTYSSERSPNLWVRLYAAPAYRALPVARLVWIVATGTPLPDGWEIHHIDLDPLFNGFENLLALHPKDHNKFHNGIIGGSKVEEDDVPF